MASGAVMSQTSENKDGGNKRTPCPLHGCKRVYLDVNALELHVKEHEIPAQSLPGKVLLCSTVGCSGSFSNMQKLMEHMRHHHKPNMFFMCESCRTKLRSYRGLLTHLHTCSKVLRGKSKSMETAPPQHAPVTNTNMAAVSMDQKPPGQDSESIPQQLPPQIPTQSFPAAVPQPESSAVPFLGPPYLSHSESFPYPELTQPLPQPPPLSMDNLSAAPEPSDALSKNQTQSRSLESHPAPVLASHSPSLSSAVWRKKNQGMACNRRILWEHSKGLYTCVQCGRTTTNRKEMTQHINTQHSGSNAVDDSVISATNA